MKSLLLGSAALALSATFALADTVRLGTEGAYPPYNFINDAGEVDGFERELGDELCKRAELTCEWVTNDWDSIIPNLVGGNYDTIMAGMSITDERDEVIDFTQAYIPPEASRYVGLSADADITGVVASQTGTIQAGYIAESGATLLEYATADELITALRSGEADSVFFQGAFLADIVAENDDIVWVGEPVPLGGGVGVGVRETDGELKDTLNAAITEMKEDGSLNEMLKKWFGEDTATF
ncbi:transporter substrate-binding domain-containing protein [Phaeobacter sp. HF9A]|uniref:transporter substrate-binding domain-containing protein n=1 Tax=Phaeobacter sp. HF9A TaxID=2721561 RepID=UPI0014300D83|nr:transporter substrate-binding domain-containing protein [Phaeobacter sp. HF9A]NIZ15223.1 transporter substrate-binding domain-containing protein [Phaeobacter sp. HF9A]